MEDVIRRSGCGDVVKEERNTVDSAGGDEGACKEVVVGKVDAEEVISTMETDSKAPSSSRTERDAQLESARAEMGEAREENQRLKVYLDQIMKDYQALQMQFYDIIQQEQTKKSTDTANNHQAFEEHDLVSLSLGLSRDPKKDNGTKISEISGKGADDEQVKKGLSLGLDCKFDVSESDISEKQSPLNSFEETKEESGETWPPSKALKTTRSGDDEAPVRKARVSVRARCDTSTMNDGCQWRKYGQKIAKGNPCPRAYYRCTVGPSCPVRKQVQRCADDMSILISTYEGTHNHPLPVSATAMANTTSAAASMLLSGSSSSSSSLTGSTPSANTTASAFHGLKFYPSDNSKFTNKPFHIQNPSLTSSPSYPSYPTITLDLTSNPPSSSSHFNRFSSSSHLPVPKLSSTSSLNFGSPESSTMSWGNLFPSYGSGTSQHYNRNQLASLNLGRQSVDNTIYQSYLQKNPPHQLPLPPDTIAAATKAITADPSFHSALAAALTSLIGSSGTGRSGTGGSGENLGSGDNFAQKLKWAEHFVVASSHLTSPKGNACSSSCINRPTSSNPQPGSLVFMPPSLPFSAPEGASASPGNNRDHHAT